MDIAVLVIAACGLSGWAGFEVCRATHRQRGLESDSLSVLVPDDPSGIELKHPAGSR